MTPRIQALIFRFLLFFLVGELPALTNALANPTPDYKLLGIGLLSGLAGTLEKFFAPQLVTMTGGVSTMAQAAPGVTVPAAPPQVLNPSPPAAP